MNNLQKYNYVRDAIVVKVEIEASVQIEDVGELYHQVTRRQFPDITVEVYHTNHKQYETKGHKNILVRFAGTMNPNDLIPLILPGSAIAEIIPENKALKVVNRAGNIGMIRCEEIMFKVLG